MYVANKKLKYIILLMYLTDFSISLVFYIIFHSLASTWCTPLKRNSHSIQCKMLIFNMKNTSSQLLTVKGELFIDSSAQFPLGPSSFSLQLKITLQRCIFQNVRAAIWMGPFFFSGPLSQKCPRVGSQQPHVTIGYNFSTVSFFLSLKFFYNRIIIWGPTQYWWGRLSAFSLFWWSAPSKTLPFKLNIALSRFAQSFDRFVLCCISTGGTITRPFLTKVYLLTTGIPYHLYILL